MKFRKQDMPKCSLLNQAAVRQVGRTTRPHHSCFVFTQPLCGTKGLVLPLPTTAPNQLGLKKPSYRKRADRFLGEGYRDECYTTSNQPACGPLSDEGVH